MVNTQVVDNTFWAETPQDLAQIAPKLLALAGDHTIWLLEGQMGAGKTTLVQYLAASLGVEEEVTSPTFSIIQEYVNDQGTSIYHFDFYRLQQAREAHAIGCEEYFDSGALCLIEWGSQVPEIIPPQHVLVQIEMQADGRRKIVLETHD